MRLAVVLATPVLLFAADFWVEREPAQWSADEIKRIVTDSPWAANGAVTVSDGAVRPRILVRWESAAPVLEACERGGLEPHLYSCVSKIWSMAGLGSKFEQARKDYYIVSLSHYPKPPGGAQAPEHSPAARAELERLGQRLREATFLKRPGKPPLQPDHVLVFPAGPTIRIQIFFPRSEAIGIEDEELLFESIGPTVQVRAGFSLRRMVYKGAIEL